jgi:hypothetical protein
VLFAVQAGRVYFSAGAVWAGALLRARPRSPGQRMT